MSAVQAWILERAQRILVISVIAIRFGAVALLAEFMAVPALVELNEQTQLPFGYALTVFLTGLGLLWIRVTSTWLAEVNS